MAMKDVSDLAVCLAYQYRTSGHNAAMPYTILAAATGQCEKVCYRAMERAYSRRFIDCGVSLRTGWLTDKGKALIQQAVHQDRESRTARTKLVNVYYKERNEDSVTVVRQHEGHFNIEVAFSGRRAGLETDRESLVRLRDNLIKLLGSE